MGTIASFALGLLTPIHLLHAFSTVGGEAVAAKT